MTERKQNETMWLPSAEQIKLAELLLNPEDRRSKTAKMEEVGVSRATFYRWMKEKNYKSYLKEMLDTYTDGELPDMWRALIQKGKRGDTAAIKLYMEMKGEYVPPTQKLEHEVEIQVVFNIPRPPKEMPDIDEEINGYEGTE